MRTERLLASFLLAGFMVLFGSHSKSQVNVERSIDLLLEKVREYSFGDSANLFNTGSKVIDFAKKQGRPEHVAQVYIFYGNHCYYQTNYACAGSYYRKALGLATQSGKNNIGRQARVRLVAIEEEAGRKELAEQAYRKILREATEENDTLSMVESLNGLANLHATQNKISEALELYHAAILLSERARLDYQRAYLCNNLGLLKHENGLSNEAMVDLRQALYLGREVGNVTLAGNLSINIGLLYFNRQQYDSALYYFHSSLQIASENNLPRIRSIAYMDISQVYSSLGLFDECLLYYDSMATVVESYGLNDLRSKLLLGRASAYLNQNDPGKAIEYAKLAQSSAIEFGLGSDILYSYSILHRSYAMAGNFPLAYDNHLLYKKYDDSLNALAAQERFNELLVQFDVDQKERKLEEEKRKVQLLQTENELRETRRNTVFASTVAIAAVVVGILVAIILSGFLYYSRKSKREQEIFSGRLLENIDQERRRIARDLHDEVGPMLSMIKNKLFVGNAGTAIPGYEEIDRYFSSVIEQTRLISHQLYPSFLEKVGLAASLREYLENTEKSAGILCLKELDNTVETLSVEQKHHILCIVRECVSNTLRHANATSLKLTLSYSDESIRMIYQDNGIGYSAAKGPTGIGMMSIAERVKLLNGIFKVISTDNKGTKLIFKFLCINPPAKP